MAYCKRKGCINSLGVWLVRAPWLIGRGEGGGALKKEASRGVKGLKGSKTELKKRGEERFQ